MFFSFKVKFAVYVLNLVLVFSSPNLVVVKFVKVVEIVEHLEAFRAQLLCPFELAHLPIQLNHWFSVDLSFNFDHHLCYQS